MGAANGVNDDATSEGEIDLADVIPTTSALGSAGKQLQTCESLVYSSPSTMCIGINKSTTPKCALPSDQLLAAIPRTTCFKTADNGSNSSSVKMRVSCNWLVLFAVYNGQSYVGSVQVWSNSKHIRFSPSQ